MTKNDIAVVIVAHRFYPQLPGLIDDLEMLDSRPTIFLVDNGSGGIALQGITSDILNIVHLSSRRNLHYCGGSNIGLRAAISAGFKYALLLNPDVRICNPDFLDCLADHLDSNTSCCFCGPRVYTRSDNEYLRIQNTIYHFPSLARIFLSFITTKATCFRPDPIFYDAPIKVDYLNGVCVLVSLAKLKRVGFLNIKLGGYYEDADWAYRAFRHGFSSHYVPVDSVVHYQDSSEYADYTIKCYMLRRNLLYIFLSQRKFISFFLYFIFSASLLCSKALLLVFSASYSEARLYCYLIFRYALSFLSLVLGQRVTSKWFGPPLGIDYKVILSHHL